MTTTSPHMLTPSQIANALMVSRSTIYGLLDSGTLPSVSIGRCRRVPVAAFEDYLDSVSPRVVEADRS